MTVPEDQKRISGKRRLEHGGPERDELLKLQTDNDPTAAIYPLFKPISTVVAEDACTVCFLFLTGCTCYDYSQA